MERIQEIDEQEVNEDWDSERLEGPSWYSAKKGVNSDVEGE
jgi:hypothetical protein